MKIEELFLRNKRYTVEDASVKLGSVQRVYNAVGHGYLEYTNKAKSRVMLGKDYLRHLERNNEKIKI